MSLAALQKELLAEEPTSASHMTDGVTHLFFHPIDNNHGHQV